MIQHIRCHLATLKLGVAFTLLVTLFSGSVSALQAPTDLVPGEFEGWTRRWVAGSRGPEWILYQASRAEDGPGADDGLAAREETGERDDLEDPTDRAGRSELDGMTMRSLMTLHRLDSAIGLEQITLAGLHANPGEPGDAVALVWAPSPSNWFGTAWSLQLHSTHGVDHRGRKANVVELATVMPTVGHAYETYLSVAPQSGAVAISVVDLIDNKVLYRGTHRIYALGDAEIPMVGLRTKKALPIQDGGWLADPPVSIEAVSVTSGYVPVGASWTVGTSTGGGQIIPVQRFDFDETVSIRLTGLADVKPEGTFRLSLIDAHGQAHVLDAPRLVAEGLLQFQATDLPLGTGTLRLEYFGPEGKLLLAGERTLTIGSAVFHFHEVVADKAAGELRGSVTVSGKGGGVELGMQLEAVLERITWSPEERSYVTVLEERSLLIDDRVKLDAQGERVFFSMPLPEEPGSWVVRVVPKSTVGVGVDIVGGQERWFTTYPAADIGPGTPFTVAILPDTQLYTWSHPHIFMRQTEWLASQADKQRIGMVLHLGDVTEMNLRREWESADQSLGMLDGVIPYALTVGNHDLIDGSYSVYNRSATLLHEFFPTERFAKLSGTFEPGRAENSYHKVQLGGEPFLFLMLEYAPRDEVLEWANHVVRAHPDHTVIVVTHTYLAGSGMQRISPFSSSDYPQKSPLASVEGETVNDGEQIWDKFVRWHPNILMVWSGHIPTTTIRSRMSAGDAFNPVFELLADYQGESEGGSGWLVLLEFTQEGHIVARTYSPYLGMYNTAVDQYGFTNHLVIDVASGRVQRIAD